MQNEFVLKDAAGQSHRYDLQPHRGGEGTPLGIAIMSLLVEPLAVGAGPVLLQSLASLDIVETFKQDKAAAMLAAQELINDPDILGAIDLSAIGSSVRVAMSRISPDLMARILRYTNRDGKALIDGKGRFSTDYDEAYSQNYLELFSALWLVAKFNGFFPALSTIGGGGKRASGAEPGPPKRPA